MVVHRAKDVLLALYCTYQPTHASFSFLLVQRKQYKLFKAGKASSITEERIRLLEELDFAWSAQETAWSRNLSQLVEFKKRNGHCHVPLSDPEFPKLGLWIKEQRR